MNVIVVTCHVQALPAIPAMSTNNVLTVCQVERGGGTKKEGALERKTTSGQRNSAKHCYRWKQGRKEGLSDMERVGM